MAVAKEQEMAAEVQAMKAKVVEAEAEVPLAIANALKEGNMGFMDYYNMRNILADTDMRSSISKMAEERQKNKKLRGGRKKMFPKRKLFLIFFIFIISN